ncbi:hypothetical protein [Methylobacterium indicum]|uniref:DUF5983 domain-containing protein n=1 Tax=Methylobacterium indicum TaxID=1775910 RepID=A0A8H9CA54_9HYPH|nr:hypothetical protein [Methylobacterium indicum]BCM87786.1 hypothetical protein mvi_62470 [Methylobacterium indicum]
MNQSKEQLLATIDKIRRAIEADDSFEGHLTYTLEWSTGDKTEFEVSGAYRIGNSEGQGGMAVLAPSVPSVEQPVLETPKMLVLRTSHVERRTSLRLDKVLSSKGPICFNKGEYGWFIPIIPWNEMDQAERANWTPDLMAIRRLAENNGCTWIMLDRDADTIDVLTTYEW